MLSLILWIPTILLAAMSVVLLYTVMIRANKVGTNRIARLKLLWLAALHPHYFVVGFPGLTRDIMETEFTAVLRGRIKNAAYHEKKASDWLEQHNGGLDHE